VAKDEDVKVQYSIRRVREGKIPEVSLTPRGDLIVLKVKAIKKTRCDFHCRADSKEMRVN
jgi:hypothetical protein